MNDGKHHKKECAKLAKGEKKSLEDDNNDNCYMKPSENEMCLGETAVLRLVACVKSHA
jgi:hypothetical protein